jgi:hypothetical protein
MSSPSRAAHRFLLVSVAQDNAPTHVPFHQATRIPPPTCSTVGIAPWLTSGYREAGLEIDKGDETLAVREDGRPVSNTVYHAIVRDLTRVSDAIGRGFQCTRSQLEMRVSERDELAYPWYTSEEGHLCRLQLQQPGDRTPPVIGIEAGCNVGKSYAVHHELIRPMLLDNPSLPMLHFSVRITHADDLYQTCLEHYVEPRCVPFWSPRSQRFRWPDECPPSVVA